MEFTGTDFRRERKQETEDKKKRLNQYYKDLINTLKSGKSELTIKMPKYWDYVGVNIDMHSGQFFRVFAQLIPDSKSIQKLRWEGYLSGDSLNEDFFYKSVASNTSITTLEINNVGCNIRNDLDKFCEMIASNKTIKNIRYAGTFYREDKSGEAQAVSDEEARVYLENALGRSNCEKFVWEGRWQNWDIKCKLDRKFSLFQPASDSSAQATQSAEYKHS